MPMLGLGAVLLVEGETGSYGLAGAVVRHARPVSFGVASPLWARAMDRRGQGVVLRVAMTGVPRHRRRVRRRRSSPARPRWSWFLLAGADRRQRAEHRLDGAGPLGGTRWTPTGRQTAFAFESVVDEVVFVVGPPLVTLLATLIARRSAS